MLSDRDYYREAYAPPGRSAVKTLIMLNCVAYLLMHWTGASGEGLQEFSALVPHRQYVFQVWRLVTYAFAHGNFWHLFWNMYALHLFGRLVEEPLGRNRFLVLYFTSSTIGALCWMAANWGSQTWCVGASGAVFGVMVAAAMAFPQQRFFLLLPPVPVKLWVLVLFYCLIEIYSSFNMSSQVAHLAHLGGALGGFLYMRRLGLRLRGGADLLSDLGVWLRGRFRRPARPGKILYHDFGQATDESRELDQILDKVSQVGYEQLTEREREQLRRASERLRRRD